MKIRFAKLFLFTVAAFTILGPGATPSARAAAQRYLTLGRITGEPGNNLEKLNAMADYLGTALRPEGIAGVKVVIASTPDKMREMLQNGEVDLFSETAFVALELMEGGLAEPLLREWKKGAAQYHTVIIARADGDVSSLGDLKGRKFAFEDPGSTSAYLIPRVALEAAGLTLEKLENPRDAPTGDAVGYGFANGEINIVAWVNRGLADAGALSNLDWEDPKKAPERFRAGLRIIHETQPIIRSLMMVRATLDADMKERLASVLSHMHETPEGKAVLKKYAMVARYDTLAGDALAGLDSARRIWRQARMLNE